MEATSAHLLLKMVVALAVVAHDLGYRAAPVAGTDDSDPLLCRHSGELSEGKSCTGTARVSKGTLSIRPIRGHKRTIIFFCVRTTGKPSKIKKLFTSTFWYFGGCFSVLPGVARQNSVRRGRNPREKNENRPSVAVWVI